MTCNRDCDETDPSNYRPNSEHYAQCPVWSKMFHYNFDTVEDILS